MLVLTRKQGEEILIGDDIRIKIIRTGGNVRIGIDAPDHIRVVRSELEKLPESCPKCSGVGHTGSECLS